MNTCCELGTRLYSENKLVNKENTVFLLSRHTVTAGPMDPSPSPCSACLSGADAHRQHLPGSHIAGLPSVPPQHSTGGRSEGQRSEDHLCALLRPFSGSHFFQVATLNRVPWETMVSWALPLHVFRSHLVILDAGISQHHVFLLFINIPVAASILVSSICLLSSPQISISYIMQTVFLT